MLTVTSIYASLTALVFLTLSARVIAYRRSNQISLGDDGDKSLLKRMRAQANCAEYAPIGLILLALAELQGAPAIALHLLGLTLFAGRAIHAYGFSASPPVMGLRVVGMLLTLTMIGISALGLLVQAIL
ncbi:MAPEG family protein [Actibacterium sp. 188UL27-1]|uniref:MAPEG family protein n=1 Tax=Actibacterium sp. 188UL27-1 TaxID=2786961 RepID=UPI001955F69F|nr:MAPEG family protein [Actibacterium sp. 188UL27-1]MBM7068444.1 MAPEG family protein [Actibacterium sp. 188UL27-1]